jgi:hypothetical protein
MLQTCRGFDRVFVLPDSDDQPPHRSQDRVGVTVTPGDTAEFEPPPAPVRNGKVTVFGAGVPETTVDEDCDARASQEHIDPLAPIPARNRLIDDEPKTSAV